MAIYRLLKYSAFGPEQIEIMTRAYEETLLALELPPGDNPVTRLVAQKIIQLVQAGELDTLRLSSRAIAELGIPNAA